MGKINNFYVGFVYFTVLVFYSEEILLDLDTFGFIRAALWFKRAVVWFRIINNGLNSKW